MEKKPTTLYEYYAGELKAVHDYYHTKAVHDYYHTGELKAVGTKPSDDYICTGCKKEVKHFNIIDGAYSCILCGTPTFEYRISMEDYKNIVNVITKRDISFD